MFKLYSKFMAYVVLTIVLLGIVGGIMSVAGVFKERVVFENSFQYTEGMAQRVKVLEAQIEELKVLRQQHPEQAESIDAQMRVLRVQANVAK